MRRLIFLIVMMWTAGSWGATYYVDKRTGNNSNSAAQAQNIDTPWKDFTAACDSAKTGAGDHTIEVVSGSGPYYPADCNLLSLKYFYSNQTSTMTWNFNGNELQFDINVNNGSWQWNASSTAGQYYLTAVGGGAPQLPATHGTGAFAQINSVVIGDRVLGDWNDTNTNLASGAASYKANNFRWGDFDTLGFSTLYIKLSTSDSPALHPEIGVWVTQSTYVVRLQAGTRHIFNNGIFRGMNHASNGIFTLEKPATINKSLLVNSQYNAIYVNNAAAAGSIVQNSKFVNAGHNGIMWNAAANFVMYNNFFDRLHLAAKDANLACTLTYRNNATKNMYTGGIQHDNAAFTLTEDHNQWHIDPQSTHGGKAIAFTTGARQWTTTASTDIPASTATTNTAGIDPKVNSIGKPNFNSPLKNAGTDVSLTTDFDGKLYNGKFPIGAYIPVLLGGSSFSNFSINWQW